MVTDALRQVMLAAEGAGELTGAGVCRGRSEHPVCGDVIELDLRLEHGRICELAWRAEGCPATMAVAALARRALHGQAVAEASQRLRHQLADLGGLDRTEQHAVALFERAVAQAVAP